MVAEATSDTMGLQDEERGLQQGNGGGPCKTCVDITKWLPVLFIISVISWSYYAFVIQLCLIAMSEIWLKIITLSIYHIVLVLFLWAYWQTIFSSSGKIPRKFRISQRDFERMESATTEQEVNDVLETIVGSHQLPVQTRTNISQIRYCEKCLIVKPDRCHHCSVCGRCILKMDHHCPWVNNCVCFDNYKFFVLFLVYAFAYCFVIFVFSMPYFIDFWNSGWNGTGPAAGRFHVLFVFFVAGMFAVSLVSLFGYHCYLITKNRSTLESFRSPIFRDGPDRKGFSLGSYDNFIEIFGENKRMWFLPVFTSLGDGITFLTRHNMNNPTGNYNSIDTTDASSTSPDYDRCVEVKVEPKTEDMKMEMDQNNVIPETQNGHNHLNEINSKLAPLSTQKEIPLVYF